MDTPGKKNLNAYRGWLLVFLVMHAPIAVYNTLGGLTLIGTFIGHKTPVWFILLSAALSFLLPVTMILLLKRKAVFRWFYVLYTILMSANFLMAQGVSSVSVFIVIVCTAPWILYLFKSERVKSVLENKIPTP